MWYFWHGFHQVFGPIQRIYTIMATLHTYLHTLPRSIAAVSLYLNKMTPLRRTHKLAAQQASCQSRVPCSASTHTP